MPNLFETAVRTAGCISRLRTRQRFDYDRDHPFLRSGTGPSPRWASTVPTLCFGTRVQPGHGRTSPGTPRKPPPTYEFSRCSAAVHRRQRPGPAGRRSTTVSRTSPRRRDLRVARHPQTPRRSCWSVEGLRRLVGAACDSSGAGPHRHRRHRPPPVDAQAGRGATAGGEALTGATGPERGCSSRSGSATPARPTMIAPRLTPGGLATSTRPLALRPDPDQAIVICR